VLVLSPPASRLSRHADAVEALDGDRGPTPARLTYHHGADDSRRAMSAPGRKSWRCAVLG
jgi:hypothetical protein